MKFHYVYHAIQKNGKPKVGCTSQPNIRFKRYITANLLEAYTCSKKAGDREIELNDLYGYEQDTHHYTVMIKKRNYSKKRNKKVSEGLKKAWKEGRRNSIDTSYATDEFRKEKSEYFKKMWKNPKRKEKQAKGESAGIAKLTANDVISMREEYRTTKTTYNKLSEKYNISPATVNQILNYKTWKHIN